MSVISRAFCRQLLNKSKIYQKSSLLTLVFKNDQQNRNYSRQKLFSENGFSPFLITFGICASSIASYFYFKDYLKSFSILPQVAASTQIISPRKQFNFIADVVENSSKSLVYIEILDSRRMDYMTGKPLTISNGSGFIVSSDGLILTNAHVVINKPRSIVSVRLADGRTFQGMIEAVDPTSDLATIRINCKNLPPMKLGSSSNLRSGEFVVALGSPLSLSNTVTSGVVSSIRPSKELGLQDKDINYIQTDAAITFGNSGGPLVNLDSEVIGINSMKVTAGISFAIPIDYAKNFLKLAEERIKVGKKLPESEDLKKRKYIGITMLSLTEDIIRELKQRGSSIPEDIQHGILVWKVIQGSPAHLAGLQAGDIILSINGRDVRQSGDIYEILTDSKDMFGNVLIMHVWRGRQKIKVAVTPEAAE
ncbi:hypothetical protein PVAND_001596 [Polypedilum vanderplanki]|uniref:Serine protease HTRA2, mitochondrial n=1 Tax=Polypedilum vanderplanki TaxID=319348 RepID=A0A9J6BPP6_POLVA|nr:hypothetical protein PVAND_001596 [Polypedilum vanderplanki]